MDSTAYSVPGQILDLAAQNLACAINAYSRGQYASAITNARAASSLLDRFNARFGGLDTSGSHTAPDNSSINNANTPTEKAEEKQTSTPREDAGAHA